jgi:hypothetical protein
MNIQNKYENLMQHMVGIDSVPKLPLQHHLKATFTGLITHFSKSMSTTLPATTNRAPRANWNDAKITALIDVVNSVLLPSIALNCLPGCCTGVFNCSGILDQVGVKAAVRGYL